MPVTRTWAEIGYGVNPRNESSVSITPGRELFARLKPREQLHILGPRAFGAYRAGDIDITDLVRTTRSPEWGITRSRGLAQAGARGEVMPLHNGTVQF